MLLATWPLHDFARFLQIISWIILPFLLLAVLFTLLMHYRQRRKTKSNSKLHQGLDNALPSEMAGYSNHKKISFHHARYKSLKQDFQILQQLYQETDQELSSLSDEMERQDAVIDQLRTDLAEREKQLSQMQAVVNLQSEKLSTLDSQLKDAHVQIEIMKPGNRAEQLISIPGQAGLNEQPVLAQAWLRD